MRGMDKKPKKSKLLTPIGMQRSYGRTASRMSIEQQEKLESRIVVYALRDGDFSNFDKVELEIGMGNGLAMLERAKANPNRLYIGNEVYKNGLRTLVFRLENNAEIKNVRIVGDDARIMLEGFSNECIDRVCVHYPDPWPKKKHNKRRIVNADLLDVVHKVLKNDGELFMVTDIPDYAQWMIAKVYAHKGFVMDNITSPDEWAKAPDWWVSTKYEQKAFKEGRMPWYLPAVKSL